MIYVPKHGDPVNVKDARTEEFITRGLYHVDEDGKRSVRTKMGRIVPLDENPFLVVWPTGHKRFKNLEFKV